MYYDIIKKITVAVNQGDKYGKHDNQILCKF